MHEIREVKRCHPHRRLGPAEVLGSADCERHKPSLIRSKCAYSSSIYRWSRVCLLNIFFMPFQMEDMNVRESTGGGWRQNSSSFSSSNCSSEEDSVGISSGWTIGVQTVWRQLLYVLATLSGATKTQSYAENPTYGRKFLHKRVTNTG